MPRKTFLNGFPLPASDLNNYLMDQAVMTFASSAARTSAIASPVEGMLTYLEDTNTYETWNGSAWVDILLPAIPKSTVTTAGDLILATGAAAVTRLPIGATGRVLSSNGTTASWELPPAASPAYTWTLLNSGGTLLTGAAIITITGLSGYNNLYVRVVEGSSASASSVFGIRLNTATTNYIHDQIAITAGAGYSAANFAGVSDNQTSIRIARMTNNASSNVSGVVNVSGASTAGVKILNYSVGVNPSSGDNHILTSGGGTWSDSAVVTSLSIVSSAGNFDNGRIWIYGA